MRSPRTLLALTIVASLLAPVLLSAADPGTKTTKSKTTKSKKTRKTPAQRIADSLRTLDSLRVVAAKLARTHAAQREVRSLTGSGIMCR